jgi:hypothetical protein
MSRLKELSAFLKTVPEGFSKWELELAYCLVILRRCNGNRGKAAKLLRISLRSLSSYVAIIADLVDDCPIGLAGVRRYPDLAPVLDALVANDGSRVKTACALRISTTTLFCYIRELRESGISVPAAPPNKGPPPRPKRERTAIVRRYRKNYYS